MAVRRDFSKTVPQKSVSSSIFFENGILEARRLGLGCAMASHGIRRAQGPECAPA
jgi:hypothetical protein